MSVPAVQTQTAARNVGRGLPRLSGISSGAVLYGIAAALALLIVSLLLVVVWSTFVVGQPRVGELGKPNRQSHVAV